MPRRQGRSLLLVFLGFAQLCAACAAAAPATVETPPSQTHDAPPALEARPGPGAAPANSGLDFQREQLQLANDFLMQGEHDLAVVHLLAIVQSEPASEEKLHALLLLAHLALYEEQPTRAIEVLDRYGPLLSPHVDLTLSRAEAYRALGDREAFLQQLTIALTHAPERVDLAATLTLARAAQGSPESLAQAQATYANSVTTTVTLLSDPEQSPETLVSILRNLDRVREPRLVAPMLALLSHPNQEVVAAAFETLIYTAEPSFLMEAFAERIPLEERPLVREALQSAIDFLRDSPPPMEGLLEVPPSSADGAGQGD